MADKHPMMTTSNAAVVNPLDLGKRVKAVRQQLNITLEEASHRTGLAKSTLSKIENNKISPTFEAIRKLTHGLDIDVPQLFIDSSSEHSTGRRSISRKGEGKPHATPTYEHELLNTELINKRMFPFKTIVRARSFDEFTDWVRHKGEEFLYVLEGSICFYSEFYEPIALHQGDSIYYDSDMGHVCVSISPQDACILWVSVS